MGKRHRSGETDGRTVYRRWRLWKFEFRSDLIAHDYMRRWCLLTPWFMIRVHHILRSDSREHLHDHPMDFISVILWGGYTEHTPHGQQKFTPGDVVVKKAEDLHALELLRSSAWTLVFAGPVWRDWGFQTEDGWIAAGQYEEWKRNRVRDGRVSP